MPGTSQAVTICKVFFDFISWRHVDSIKQIKKHLSYTQRAHSILGISRCITILWTEEVTLTHWKLGVPFAITVRHPFQSLITSRIASSRHDLSFIIW